MSYPALLFGSYSETDIDYEVSCHNCIRPATRLIIGIDMKSRPVCKKFDGYACCGVECDEWNMNNTICLFHGKIQNHHYGLRNLQNIVIYRYRKKHKRYIEDNITMAKHFTVKQSLEMMKFVNNGVVTDIQFVSEQFIFELLYSKALACAAKKHWMIKQVFAQYLKPELYQMEMIWD